jgi:uncharacterized Zn-finger protein
MKHHTMDSYKCEFCNEGFKNNRSLKLHQKNAKYCYKIRGIDNKQTNFVCQYCDNDFSSKQRLNSHINICGKLKEIKIFETLHSKDDEIRNLQKKLYMLQNKYEELQEKDAINTQIIKLHIDKKIDIIEICKIIYRNIINYIFIRKKSKFDLEDVKYNIDWIV